MGLLITYNDPTNTLTYSRYLRIERFEFVKETEEYARIQILMNFYSQRDSTDIEGIRHPDPSGNIPRVYNIYANYSSLHNVQMLPYIYYYYGEQCKAMGFQVENILEENQQPYVPPVGLEFPTSVQPTHSPYHYQYSTISYFLSFNQPLPF